MDQYYVDEGYWEIQYAAYQAQAQIGLEPYYVEGYIDAGYYEIGGGTFTLSASLTQIVLENAEAALESNATITINTSVIKSAESSITVTSTVTASISHIEGADLFAFSDAQLAAAVDRIRDNNISAASAFTISTDASRTRTYSSEEDAVVTITVDGLRLRGIKAATSAAFSLACDAEEIQGGNTQEADAALESSSTFAVSANVTKEFTTTLTVESQLSSTISHIEGADLTAFADASLSVDVVVTKEFISSQQSNFNYQSTEERIRNFVSSQNVAADITATAESNKPFSSTIASTTQLSAVISHIEGADLTAFADCAITADADVIRDLSSNISCSTAQTISVERIRNADSSQSCSSSLVISGLRIKQLSVSLTDAFVPTVIVTPIKNSFAVLNSNASVVANIVKTTSANSQIQTSTALVSSANVVKEFGSNINSVASQTTAGDRAYFLINPPAVNSGDRFTPLEITTGASKFGKNLFSTSRGIQSSSFTNSRLCAGNNEIIAITAGTTWKTTDNGFSWTKSSNNLPNSRTTLRFEDGHYIYCTPTLTSISAKIVYRSTNATNWTAVESVQGGNLGKHNGYWIRITAQATFQNSSQNRYRVFIQTSTDLTNWTTVSTPYDVIAVNTTPTPTVQFLDSKFANNEYKIFFTVNGSNGYVYSTTDAVTWTQEYTTSNTNFDSALWKLEFANNVWLLLGLLGFTTYYRKSGANAWAGVSNTGSTIRDNLVSFQGKFYSNRSTVRTSTDGLNWSIYSYDMNALTSGNSRLFYLSDVSGEFYTTSDAIAWITYELPETTNITGTLVFDQGTNSDWTAWNTIDLWVRFDDNTNSNIHLLGQTLTSEAYSTNFTWTISRINATQISFNWNGGSLTSGTIISTLQWYHIRVTRSGTNASLYVDGSRVATTSSFSLQSSDIPLTVFGDSSKDSRRTYAFGSINIDAVHLTGDLLTNPSTTSFTVPTTAPTATSNTKLLLNFEDTFADTRTAISTDRFGQADLNSNFSLSVIFGRSISLESNQTATTTLSASVNEIVQLQSNIATQGSVLAAFGRIRPFASLEDTSFAITANGSVTKPFGSTVSANASVTATATKAFGPVTANLTSNSQLSATGFTTKEIVIAIDDFASMNINAVKTTSTNSNQSSEFTQVTIGDSGKFANANITSQFTQTTTVTKTLGAITSTQSAVSALSADSNVITGNIVNISAQGFVVAAFGRIRPFASIEDTSFALTASAISSKLALSTISSQTQTTAEATKTFGPFAVNAQSTTTMSVSAVVKTGSVVAMDSASAQSTTARVDKTLAASVTSAMTFAVTARETSEISSDISTTTAMSVSAVKVARANSTMSITTALSATPKITRTGISLEFSFADTVVDADVIRGLQSNQASATQLSASAIRIVSGRANLTSNGFVLAVGREFRLEDSAIWVVRPETTTYTIQPEVTEWRVSLEVREYTIKE